MKRHFLPELNAPKIRPMMLGCLFRSAMHLGQSHCLPNLVNCGIGKGSRQTEHPPPEPRIDDSLARLRDWSARPHSTHQYLPSESFIRLMLVTSLPQATHFLATTALSIEMTPQRYARPLDIQKVMWRIVNRKPWIGEGIYVEPRRNKTPADGVSGLFMQPAEEKRGICRENYWKSGRSHDKKGNYPRHGGRGRAIPPHLAGKGPWMVARYILLAAALALLAGCRNDTTMVAQVSPPSFNAPNIAPQPRQALPPVVNVKPQPPRVMPVQPPQARAGKGVPQEWIPRAQLRPWKWIVIHHSATATGGAAAFDKMHKAKGWDGLGYDFVIGNGTDTGNGQIEVGFRWTQQLDGAHAKTPDNDFNKLGIGICLVGNFDETNPSPQQMASLAKLVGYLEKTYRITPDRILGHGDTKITACPGRHMNLAIVRRMAAQAMAEADIESPADLPTAQAEGLPELMRDLQH